MSLAERIALVNEKIAAAARQAGREPSEVTLVAATKVQTSETIRAAIAAGVPVCGENRVQREDGWCKSFPAVAEVVSELFLGSAVHCVGTEKRVFPLLNSNRQFV